MHAAEKSLAKTCHKLAKWFPEQCKFQVLPNGFLLTLHGDSEFTPAIGVVDGSLVGALDAYDAFLDMLGYECQIERVLFDAERMRFILDAGWSAKYWRKPTPKQLVDQSDFTVDAVAIRMPVKITAMALVLISAVSQESKRRLVKALNPFKK